MNHIKRLNVVLFAGAIVNMLLLDQITKFLVRRGVIGEFTFQRNDGVAFGIDLPMWIQIVGSALILYLLFGIGMEYIFKSDEKAYGKAMFLGLVLGGGLGNLIDRLMSGYVIDFIVLKPFPVFNFADVGITIGLILLFVTIIADLK